VSLVFKGVCVLTEAVGQREHFTGSSNGVSYASFLCRPH